MILNDAVDTWDDWKVVSLKKPVFNEPELKEDYVDVPGSNGSLDMSEVLTGYPLFENRHGTLQFFLYDDSLTANTKLTKIRNYLHGRKHKIILNDEPEYYYVGRLMMHESHPTTEGEYAVFDLEYNLEPYKYEVAASDEDWLWDPFNFETGVIRDYRNIEVFEEEFTTVTVIGSPKPTVPIFIVEKVGTGHVDDGGTWFPVQLMIEGDGTIYGLKEGTNVIPKIVLHNQEYELKFTNNDANVTIRYRGGAL